MKQYLSQSGIFIIYLLLCVNASATESTAFQIREAVTSQVMSLYSQAMTEFEPDRLKLHFDRTLQSINQPICAKTLIFDRMGDLPLGRKTIKVTCTDDKSWSVYLPLQVSYVMPVAVTATSISRDQILTASAISLVDKDIGDIRGGYYQAIDNVTGLSAKRSLKPGVILTPVILGAPELIERGDKVMIIARAGGMEVRMSGVAMTSGRLDTQIPVKNLKTGKVIRARVIGAQKVEVSI